MLYVREYFAGQGIIAGRVQVVGSAEEK